VEPTECDAAAAAAAAAAVSASTEYPFKHLVFSI